MNLIGMPRAAWKRQPSGRVTASNFWRSRGLVALFRFYPTLIDVIDPASTRATIAAFGTPTTGVSRYGVGLKTTTNSGYKAEYPIPLCADAETHIGLVNITARTTYGAVFALANQTGATNKLSFQYGNYDLPGIYVGNAPYSSIFNPLNAGFFMFGLSGSTGSYVRLYIDGKLNLNPSVYTPALTTARMVFLGEREATSTYATQGDYVVHATFNTILSHAEHAEIARNVWQLFAPDPPRFYLIPSSGSVGNYQLTSSLTSTSSTSSSALQVLRALQASLTSSSSTASITLDTAALISLLSAITSASSTSTSAAAIQRTILTALTSASSTPSSALNIQRALSSTVTSTSETATITLSIAGLIALLTAISSTSSTSTASASVQRALASALTSSSSTASITLNTTTLIALLSAVTSGSLTATSALNIARSLSSAINSISSTPSIVLPVQRSLIASHTSQSSTSISALELVNLIALASAINSQSSTSTVTANLVRALVSNLLSASSTSTISLPVLREFASTLVSTSLTDSIDLSLAMLGQVDLVSVIESRSLTNPQVRLLADLVAAIQTEMKLHMVGVAPSFTMTGSGPSIAVHRT